MCYGSAEDADSTIATSPAAASSADASHAAKCHAVWNKHHDASCAAPSTTDDADGATNATNVAAKSTDDTDGTKPIATSTSSYATSVPWPLKFVVTENQVGSFGPISMNNFEKTADIGWFFGLGRDPKWSYFFNKDVMNHLSHHLCGTVLVPSKCLMIQTFSNKERPYISISSQIPTKL